MSMSKNDPIELCIICQNDFDVDDIIVTNNNCDCKIRYHNKCYKEFIKKSENNYCPVCKNKESIISNETKVVIDISNSDVIVKQSNSRLKCKKLRKFVFLNIYKPIMKFYENNKKQINCNSRISQVNNYIEENSINCCCICCWIKGFLSFLIGLIGQFIIGFIFNMFLCTNWKGTFGCYICLITSILSGFSALFLLLVIFGSIQEKYVNRVYLIYSFLNATNFVTSIITDDDCKILFSLSFLILLIWVICNCCMHSLDIRNCND